MIKSIFYSESVKLKRSPFLYLNIAFLVLFPIVMAVYFGARKNIVSSRNIVILFFEILAMITPILISIVVSITYDREEKAGDFKNWLSEPIEKSRLIQDQLYYYWIWYALEIICVSLIFYLITYFVYKISGISFISFIVTAIVFAFLGLFQYEITEMVALKWNVGSALVLGFFGTVLSLLGITSLLDFIWPIIPWTWQIRLIAFWQVGISPGLRNIFLIEYIVPIVMTVICLILGKRYFDKWQPK